ncbi:MAG: lipopolysaccharide transport periplasmic protein LptA [Cypionkella sp.]
MTLFRTTLLTLCLLLANLSGANAEGTNVTFGGIKADTSLPVEVTADSLSVNQADGQAVFSGNVLVTQGEMRMTAAEITVQYEEGGKGIKTLHATGKVLLISAADAVEADTALYTIATGQVALTGSVLLTQGQATISGQQMLVDLKSGTGKMQGRVTTTFIPGKK